MNEQVDKDFETLFDSEFDVIVKFASKLVQSKETSEDIVAEAFARAYARWSTLKNHEAPEKWLTRVAFNLSMDHLRKSKRNDKFFSLFGKDTFGIEFQEHDSSFEPMIKDLPKRQQEIVLLKYVCDYTTEEICAALALKPTTVYTQLDRANKKLKLDLETFPA